MSETIVPIYDPNRGFRSWFINEIYQTGGEGKYVPNINDLVIDYSRGMFRITDVDLTTGVSQMEPWSPNMEEHNDDNDLVGIDIGSQAESFRVYIDTSVMPHTLACDARLHVFGSSNSHIKLFKGTDISNNGTVISAMYSPSGDFLGENIPLELVATDELNNIAIKTPVVGFTNNQLEDGEIVSAVVYDDLGYAVSYNRLLVKNTSFIRSSEASKKYVAAIRLDSPYLSMSDERMLRFPMNMALEDFPAQAVITYSDGSEKRLPINDSQVELHGLDQFISTINGQKVPLVLTYLLGNEEYAYNASVGETHHISEKYWATTTEFEESYSIKIFVYPEWVDDIQGYKLNFYLTNLNRSKIYNITNLVTPTSNSDVYSPLNYGSKQNLSYSVDMSQVDPAYSKYKFVQSFNLTLMAPGTSNNTRWLVNFTSGQDIPFGTNLSANIRLVNTDLSYLDISNGFDSVEEWLRNLYRVTEPLFLNQLETQAPNPNILLIKTKRREYEVSINDWDTEISIVNDLSSGENVVIEFIQRTFENDLKLGVISLPVTLV